MVDPALLPQLPHKCIDPRETGLPEFPPLKPLLRLWGIDCIGPIEKVLADERGGAGPGKFTGISLTGRFFFFHSAITSCTRYHNSRTLREPKCRCGERRVANFGSKPVGADLGFSKVP